MYLNIATRRFSQKPSDVIFWLFNSCFSTGQQNGLFYKLARYCILDYSTLFLWYAQRMNMQAALKAMWSTVCTCGFLSTSSLKKQRRIGSCARLAWLSARELLQQLPRVISASLLADAPPRVHRGRLCRVWCDGGAKFLLATCLGYWKAEEVLGKGLAQEVDRIWLPAETLS